MTTIQSRQPQGIPAGGQFAACTHPEPDLALTVPEPRVLKVSFETDLELSEAHHDPLPEWPEGLPAPSVDYGLDGGRVEAYVEVDGKTMTFWEDQHDGTIDSTCTGEDPWEDFDEEDKAAALEWGRAVFKRIDTSLHTTLYQAAHKRSVSDAVLAHATSTPLPERAKPNLENRATRDAHAMVLAEELAELTEKLQNTYMVGAAQEVKEANPNIASFTLKSDEGRLEIAEAWDANGEPLNEGVYEASYEVFRYRDEDDFSTFHAYEKVIDVDEAIAWRP